jgi:hypothetical protein
MDRQRFSPDTNPPMPGFSATGFCEEEVLVVDPRAGLTPAQVVERKLAALLDSVPLPLSQMETAGPRRPGN